MKTFVSLHIWKRKWESTSKGHYCLSRCPLGKWWDHGPTETIEQMPAGGVQSDDKVRKPTNLSQKEKKSLWPQLKKCSWQSALTKLALKFPQKYEVDSGCFPRENNATAILKTGKWRLGTEWFINDKSSWHYFCRDTRKFLFSDVPRSSEGNDCIHSCWVFYR